MRSVIYGILITVLLTSVATVQAATIWSGQPPLCLMKSENYPVYGFVFRFGEGNEMEDG
jgi:hypothetical protein